MIKRRSREQVEKDLAKLEKLIGNRPKGQEILNSPYKSVQTVLHYIPPEILQERRDKIEEIKRTMTEKSAQEKIAQLNQLQMQKEAKRLLHFYIWNLFATNKELSFPEIVNKVNQKFRNLISEDEVAKFLLDDKKFGEDSFYECSPKNFKDRLTHFFKYPLRKKIISFKNYLRDLKGYDSVVEYLYVKETFRERMKDIELKSLTDPRLSYRANENSPFWTLYQIKLDYGMLPTELITLFPDKNSIRQYVV
ncbi:MAG: hypothetical protein QMD36_06460 [Candidatus Aenigmarchaeota archaeon]|nr:hypothetical protein [Candidatus Aenigmarchaeota archaeon]